MTIQRFTFRNVSWLFDLLSFYVHICQHFLPAIKRCLYRVKGAQCWLHQRVQRENEWVKRDFIVYSDRKCDIWLWMRIHHYKNLKMYTHSNVSISVKHLRERVNKSFKRVKLFRLRTDENSFFTKRTNFFVCWEKKMNWIHKIRVY